MKEGQMLILLTQWKKILLKIFQTCFFICFFILTVPGGYARPQPSLDSASSKRQPFSSLLFAVNEEEQPIDAYDPFIDYTEFERTQMEKQDVRFFKEGRLFSISALIGGRLFTDTMSQHLWPNISYGLQMGIFLNLLFCMQVYGLLSYHPFILQNTQAIDANGFFEFYGGGVDLKYYIDKEKLLRPLAFLNPYFVFGFSAIRREVRDVGTQSISSMGYGFRAGGGIEINLSRKFFIGLHSDFNFIHFAEEHQTWRLPGKLDRSQIVDTGVKTAGDIINALFTAGVNF